MGKRFWIAALSAGIAGCSGDYSATSSPAAGPVAAVDPVVNLKAMTAATQKFTGMPAIDHVEWLDGNFVVAARENGSSWQPVAEATCAWIRGQGMQGPFEVNILESGALSNKHWEQLAHAKCN